MKLARHTLASFVTVAFAALLGPTACNDSMPRDDDPLADSGTTPPPTTTPDSGTTAPPATPPDAAPPSVPPVSPPPEPDAGPPPTSSCAGLGPAACLANVACVPTFDDACCPSCRPSAGCADCTNPTYEACVPLTASRCPMGSSMACGITPPWGCGPAAPTCEDSHVVDVDSCDRAGCVPGYPSGEGEPPIDAAVCVPITADSCTAACRLDPGPCPDGTLPEGDGSCYTGRCIPRFVCG